MPPPLRLPIQYYFLRAWDLHRICYKVDYSRGDYSQTCEQDYLRETKKWPTAYNIIMRRKVEVLPWNGQWQMSHEI